MVSSVRSSKTTGICISRVNWSLLGTARQTPAPDYDAAGNVSSTKAEYYIRSSVLCGKVLTELRENGTKKQTNVYTGDAVIAEQMSFPADGQHSTEWGFVNWKHEDPVTGSYSRKRADGSSPTGSEPLPNAELEPLGGRIPDEDPYDPTIPPPAGLRDFRYNGGDVFRPEYGCIVDGCGLLLMAKEPRPRKARNKTETHEIGRECGSPPVVRA